MGYKEVQKKANMIQNAVRESSILLGPVREEMLEGTSVCPGLNMNTYSRILQEEAQKLDTSMFKTLFMGTFKNGKSTTINAILGKELLPVGATAATAVISQVLYGTDTGHVKIFKNGLAEPEIMELEAFLEEYKLTDDDIVMIEEKGSLDRFSDVDYVVLESENELFQDGVQLIDSPGLEEAVARTKTTERFIPQANAVVFLLDAIHPFSEKEKNYIRTHFIYAEPKPRNVFFVMNRMNQCIDDEAREQVKKQALRFLKPVFTDDNDVFDEELFRKRVFFVNSYGALQMKKQGQVPEGTGMVEFQTALEEFLTSEDRVIARYQSLAMNMAQIYLDTEKKTEEAQLLMGKPVDELRANAEKAEASLAELEEMLEETEGKIDRLEERVEKKILIDLERFLTVDLLNAWEEHAMEYDGKFGITDMLKLALPLTSDAKKEAIMAPMVTFLYDFIEEQVNKWSLNVNLLIDQDIRTLQEMITETGETLELELNRARAIFSGQEITTEYQKANKLQLALSLIQGDVSVAIENNAGGNFAWGEFVKRYAVQGIINVLIAALVGGGLPGIVAAAVTEMVQLRLHKNSTRDRLLNSLANQLFPKIEESMMDNEDEIVGEIRGQIDTVKELATATAKGLIEDELKAQADIIAQAEKTEKEIKEEKQRQKNVLEAFYARIAMIYEAVCNKKMTREGMEKFAAMAGKIEE